MGKVSVVYGCMFAGKTSWLIKKAKLLPENEVYVVKHSLDIRFHLHELQTNKGYIISHDQEKYPALVVQNLLDCFLDIVASHEYIKYIFIDEAQFFTDLIIFVDKIKETFTHIDIIIAGLDLTFRKEPFGQMRDIMNIADETIQLSAMCDSCNGKAYYTYRKTEFLDETEKNQTILVGGNQLYIPLCEQCFDIKK
jgi:thymidine kinase